MTKVELVDLVKHKLAGGDCPQELKGVYHPEILSKHITLALNYLIGTVLYRDSIKQNDYGALDAYSKSFIITNVEMDEIRGEFFFDLPVAIVSLPMGRGIRLVSYLKEHKNPFLYRQSGNVRLFENLDTDKLFGDVKYYIEGSRIRLSDAFEIENGEILLKCVCQFDNLEDDDIVNIPQAYNKLVFDLVIQSMQGRRLEKMANDGNANTN